MRSGGLVELIELFEPKTVVNDFGEEHREFVSTGRIHAERASFTGRIVNEAGEQFPDYSVKFNIRFPHRVGEGWHVVDVRDQDKVYVVAALIPNRQQRMKTIICERVNE
jgi:head-tail adaptor